MAEFRLLATDFDETLTNGKGSVPEEVISALRHFVSRGGVLLIASGRVRLSLERAIEPWGLRCFLATTNGSVLSTWPEGEVIYELELPREVALEALAAGAPLGKPHLLYDDKLYATSSGESSRYSELLRVPLYEKKALESWVGPGIRAISWRCLPERASQLRSVLQHRLCERATVTLSHRVLVDVNPKGAHKGLALRWVQKLCDLSPSQTLAVGDSPNDLTLLEGSCFSACVSNASEELKEVAHYVSSYPRARGALDSLRHFGIVE